jgi:hypothetical protein
MVKKIFWLLAILPAVVFPQDSNKEYGVFEYVVQSAHGSFENAAAAIESKATGSGWSRVAVIHSSAPENCSYRSIVFVLVDSTYTRGIMNANSKTGPFAFVDRINLFEDEKGIHVAVINPHSITRTVLMDDLKYETMAEAHLQKLRTLINNAVQGTTSNKQFGELRQQGFIGKTMGVMAGGKFDDKIEDMFVIAGGDLKTVAAKVKKGLSAQGKTWGLHVVYECALPEFQTVVFGSSGSPMDSKSFSIVKAGGDDSRDGFKCAGLAHAAAYPLEIVVVKDGNAVKVRMVDAMFRMKMFFEDAGKWAFMKNMGMPGSIKDEIMSQLSGEFAGK